MTSKHAFLKSVVGEASLEVAYVEGKGHAMPSTEVRFPSFRFRQLESSVEGAIKL